ncbi:metallophosphoesterase [Niallia endozanthoxylica]|uniref:Metallophosphoesterase n=1 Tax=Niallia endozanthoxylica TaxID=2036016 RepID=A0A5J5HLZ7_9BACI|nr:metallophosphoesterase [Niallia endozanthoxylica]KAA9021570.1 metallophosphoesterase [Niallia endozanthoxylica]
MSLTAILFVLLFAIIYFLLCFYISKNIWVWLKTYTNGKYKKTYTILFVFIAVSPFLTRAFTIPVFAWISGFWMAIIGYSLILLPLANLLYFLLKKKGIKWMGLGIMLFFAIIFSVGSFNAWNPIVRSYDVNIPKKTELPGIKILLASDLHLGPIVGVSHLQKLVDIADNVQPDLILLAGDTIDDDIEPFVENNMQKLMAELQAPLGVYAISGNHDVYGNDLLRLEHELTNAGVQVLRDETVLIQNQFYLTGRKDPAEGDRYEIQSLLKGLDKSKPIIMMDHQPNELQLAEKYGADVLVSGHTHNGQLAPANLITGMLFENDGGYLQKNSLHSFVSSGFGTWGPPLRIGSRSEVMVINLQFGVQ